MSGLRQLTERRVPQYLAVYLGAGWGVIEFISLLEERYAISPVWTDLVLLSWLLLLPSVLLYTWHHGRPGKDSWQRSEKIAIPLNLAVLLVVLTAAFGGRDLSATTVKVTVTDENGEAVERVVAKSGHRKRLALFWFDAAPADTAAEWLRIGAPLALNTDLLQDLFVDMRAPAQFREQLREAAVGDGFDVPLTLKQKIAQEMHLPYFVTGLVSSGPGGYTVRTALYETATARLVREREATGTSVYAIADELSVLLRQDLELPAARAADMKDNPVAELLSPNEAAFRGVASAQAALMRDDYAAADRELTAATELDPTFAYAQFMLYQTRSFRGDTQSGLQNLTRALQHVYRLPERLQFVIKTENYLMQQEMDKALAVATMMVELYPHDLIGHVLSAQLFVLRNERRRAIASLRRLVELDPQQHEVMLQIASLQEAEGDYEAALGTYEAYTAQFPMHAGALLKAGRVQVRLGRMSDAGASFERAAVADPTSIEAKIDLAMLQRNTGELDIAERRLLAALGMALTAEDSSRALGALQGFYDGTGRVREAVSSFERRIALAPRFLAPVQVLSAQMGSMELYVRAGRQPQAESMLDGIRTQLTGPLAEFWQQGALIIAAETGDSTRLQHSMASLRGTIDAFGFRFMEPTYVKGDAALRELRGDWAGAAQSYERLLALEPTALGTNRHIARCYRNLGRLDDALRVIDRHLITAPYSAESNLEAARIRLAQNDAAAARTHLERVAKVLQRADPGYAATAELKKLMSQAGL